MHSALLATLAATALGWSNISVTESRSGAANAPWQRSLAGLTRPNQRTEETLRRLDLEREYRRNPANALARLENRARAQPDPDLVFALAELSWIEASRGGRRQRAEALDYYLDAVAYAYDFLFDPELAAGRQPSDPRFRLAMDLYNGSVDSVLRAMKAKGAIAPGGVVTLSFRGKELPIRVDLTRSPWTADDIDELLLCSDYQVSGLPTLPYQFGLGVPLIGVRHAEDKAPPTEGADAAAAMPARVTERYFPPEEVAFPLTALLRPASALRDPGADVEGGRTCTLHLVDPVENRSVGLGQYWLAIEADLATPLAYMWSRADYGGYRWVGFLRPGDELKRTGLMMLRPYEPGKIPVVLVHGLLSTPLCWVPMVNELQRNPDIQSRYQFFLYVYPTGVPIPIAASGLRSALTQARRDLDPHGTDPGFARTVLLGHSMGGLLSHAMAVDSGDHFWNLNSYWRFSDLIGPREVLDAVRHYTFFEALPFVERVVFLATPHRGSEYANGFIGRLGSGLISQPDQYTALLTQLIRDNPEAFNTRRFRRLPTSIETLEVDSPVLMALLAMPPRPGVKFHSIIGARSPGPVASTTDGVVTYRSSHLDVDEKVVLSERVVNSGHNVQESPLAIEEVLRILREHLAEAPTVSPPATTPGRSVPVEMAVGTARGAPPAHTQAPAMAPTRPAPYPAALPSSTTPTPADVLAGPAPPSTFVPTPAAAPVASPLDSLPPLLPPVSTP